MNETLYAKFLKVLDFTLLWEGSYSDNPADSGGATNYGITQSELNTWLNSQKKPAQNVQNLTLDDAKTIYYSNYFLTLPEVDILCPELLQVLFDTAVNFGLTGCIEFIQEALSLPLTGIYDNTTKTGLLANNNVTFAIKICNNRIAYRAERVKENPSQNVFLQGWLNRDNSLLRLITPVPIAPPASDPPSLPPGTYYLAGYPVKYLFIDFTQNPPKYFPMSGDGNRKIVTIDLTNQGKETACWLDKLDVTETPASPPVVTPPTTDIVTKVLNFAEAERLKGGTDFKETGGANIGPQVAVYQAYTGGKPGDSWCCDFISYCLGQCGVNFIKTGDTWALRDYAYAVEKNIISDTPSVGDVFLVYDSSGPCHTGLVRNITGSQVNTIEGNFQDSIKENTRDISGLKFIHWQKLYI